MTSAYIWKLHEVHCDNEGALTAKSGRSLNPSTFRKAAAQETVAAIGSRWVEQARRLQWLQHR